MIDTTRNRSRMRALLAALWFLPLGCHGLGKPEFCGPHHGKDEILTVAVTGLVKAPGKQRIEPGGLRLADAIALAGGDLPKKNFQVDPARAFAVIERDNIVHYFSLPLVTHDAAGKVFLMPNDKVSVQEIDATTISQTLGVPLVLTETVQTAAIPDVAPDVAIEAAPEPKKEGRTLVAKGPEVTTQEEKAAAARVAEARSAEVKKEEVAAKARAQVKAAEVKAWDRVLGRADVGIKTLAFDVPITDIHAAPRKAAVRIAAAPRSGNGAPSIKSVTTKIRTQGAEEEPAATLLAFSQDIRTSDPVYTVLVVRRASGGKLHEYVLLRHEATSANLDSQNASKVLNEIPVLPGDALNFDVLIRVPVVLTSLAMPDRFDFARRRGCCSPLHDSLKAHSGPFVESLQLIVATPPEDERFKFTLDRPEFLAGGMGLKPLVKDDPVDMSSFESITVPNRMALAPSKTEPPS
ncbi:MAG: hypothetical protein WCL32_23150, partial [Planctomycetota bacterium]